mmetsp:Transcript_34851/g.59211  ORF Transcript_34851/g.59211 Transcript_34851/m.59211 type:complete len:85 (-) Transcript_34851:537-791(-)
MDVLPCSLFSKSRNCTDNVLRCFFFYCEDNNENNAYSKGEFYPSEFDSLLKLSMSIVFKTVMLKFFITEGGSNHSRHVYCAVKQ